MRTNLLREPGQRGAVFRTEMQITDVKDQRQATSPCAA
jgi:hypothetical protein